MGGEGVPGERANVPALWSLAWLRITSPGEAGGNDATPVPAPDPAPRPDSWPNRKSSDTLVNTLHSCGPLIFWSFDIFQLLPFPSLSFLQCHKRQKCLNNWGQRYLLAVRPLFSRHWLSAAPHRMPRTGKTTNYIIFFPLNRDNHIPIPWLLLANQIMLWGKEKKSHWILFCNFSIMLAIFVERGGTERKRRKFLQGK